MRNLLRADMRRMLTTPMFYVLTATSLVMPVLILVMTGMAGGNMNVFTNTWQIIGQTSDNLMAMDMTAICNINLVYFLTGIFMCLFVSQDFAGGYAKNLFTVRARKGGYVAAKTITGFIAGTIFLLAFLAGSIIGGRIAGLSFAAGVAGIHGIIMCMLAKVFLMGVFTAIFLAMSVIARQRAWLAILLSLFGGMLLFMMIPMMTPLDSGIANVGLCLAGGIIFAAAIGRISRRILSIVSLA